MLKVFTVFNPPGDPGVDCSKDVPLTKQSFKDEADINVLIARYGEAVVASSGGEASREMFYGDFSDGLDYLAARQSILNAEAAFQSLPAQLRDRFRNDPGELLEFIQDEANHEEAVKLGLLVRKEPAAPAPAGAPAAAGGADAGVVEPDAVKK